MRFLTLYLIIFISFGNACYSRNLYENGLSSSASRLSGINSNIQSCLFMPSRLIISDDNKILVKGGSGNFVSLAYSRSSGGDKLLMGQKVRLGKDFKLIVGKINDNGFVELNLSLKDCNFSEGDNLYLELVSWSEKEPKDVKVAQIYGTDGKITNYNSVEIVKKIINSSLPMFSPAMGMAPNVNTNINDTVDAFKNINDNNYDASKYSYPKQMFYEKPSMFLNIDAPEMQRK